MMEATYLDINVELRLVGDVKYELQVDDAVEDANSSGVHKTAREERHERDGLSPEL